MKYLVFLLTMSLSFVFSANAALVDNGDRTITQTRNDGSMLMWLQDANYAYTSGYDTNGLMNWTDARGWIDYLNNNTYLGYNDWRLPDTLPVNGINYNFSSSFDGSTDIGWNITSVKSEMGYMFYTELGNVGRYDTSGNGPLSEMGLKNVGPFINIQEAYYWSHPDVASASTHAMAFQFNEGTQDDRAKSYENYAWAVRSAGVAPEPISSTLFIVGGATLGFRRFRKKIKSI